MTRRLVALLAVATLAAACNPPPASDVATSGTTAPPTTLPAITAPHHPVRATVATQQAILDERVLVLAAAVHQRAVIEVAVAVAEREAAERRRVAAAKAEAARKAAPSTPKAAPVATGNVWDRLQSCECPPGWHCNTGNGYYGGLQFSLESWRAVGGTGYPHEHSRATQIAMGERLRAMQGWGAWPACSKKMGLR